MIQMLNKLNSNVEKDTYNNSDTCLLIGTSCIENVACSS